MFPVGPSRQRNRGRGFAFNRGAKIPPSLLLPFAGATSLDSRITYTGSNGTYFNSSGVLTAATTNVARLDYNPSTLAARGLLIEEARTNGIRNNTMQGASAGTPGTAPTNWTLTFTGLTISVVGTGTENGISYIDIRVNGTTGSTSGVIRFESNTQVAASQNQVWTSSSYIRRTAGSNSNITAIYLTVLERDGAGAALGETDTDITSSLGASSIAGNRQTATRTMASASTAFVNSSIAFGYSSGVAIDITLRIGMPQLELGAFVTSVISTSSAAVTRSADIASMTGTNFSSWYNQSQGTFVVSYLLDHTIPAAQFPTALSANDGTTNNQISTYAFVAAGNNRSSFICSVAGVTQSDLGSASATFNGSVGTAHKLAGAYAANNFAASFDGSATLTDTSGSLPAPDRLTIGVIGTQYLNGWIQSIQYYPQRLPDSTLRALSV